MRRWINPDVRRTLVAGTQAGAAAGVAWLLAQIILSSPNPIYAPVAAVVVIGAGYERRVERVKSMLSGMAVAVAISEIGIRLLGAGVVTMAVLTAASVVAAKFLLDDLVAVSYAGVNAALLVALGGDGWVPDRLLEGLVGAATAYSLIYFVFPPRPQNHIGPAVDRHISTATSSLRRVSAALRAADPAAAEKAERGSERIDQHAAELAASFDFSAEVVRFSPWRHREAATTERVRRKTRHAHAILRDAMALVRIAGWQIRSQTRPEPHLADAIEAVADAIDAMGSLARESRPDDARSRRQDIASHVGRARTLADEVCENGDDAHTATCEAVRAVATEVEWWADEVSNADGPETVEEYRSA